MLIYKKKLKMKELKVSTVLKSENVKTESSSQEAALAVDVISYF